MEVKRLIEILKQMPQEASVWHLWDGEARTEIEHVWISKSGEVITADNNEPCYSTETRPVNAPTEVEDRDWHTPKK